MILGNRILSRYIMGRVLDFLFILEIDLRGNFVFPNLKELKQITGTK